MRGWFRSLRWGRRRPVTVRIEQLSREQIADLITASAWDLTETQWYALTDFERKECRRLVTTAPKFEVTT